MNEAELVNTISKILDDKLVNALHPINEKLEQTNEKFNPILERLERLEVNSTYMNEKINLVNQKVDDLKLDVKFSQKSLQKDIAKLKDAQDTVIGILEHKGILKMN